MVVKVNLASELRLKAKTLFNSNVGFRLRHLLRYRPPMAFKPSDKKASVSDMFFWKEDERWETMFNLTNIGTSILPDEPIEDHVVLIILDDQGNTILEKNYVLKPHEMKRILFKDFKLKGKGSFACFHDIGEYSALLEQGSHVIDRGYIGYRRDKKLWNFIHGNLIAACYDKKKHNHIQGLLITNIIKQNTYRPQVTFDDCCQFSIVCINTSSKIQAIDIEKRLVSGQSQILKETLAPLSTHEILIENPDKSIRHIYIHSKIVMFRPIIFKSYDYYFDAFHS